MKKLTLTGCLLISAVAVSPSLYADLALDNCIKQIKAQQPGYIIKLEKLNFAGKGVFEFEIVDLKQGEWEFLCDAKTGQIIEEESEVSDPKEDAFKKNVKISEEEAAKIALKNYPGKIEEVEYEIEKNGASSYEFDILSVQGIETKVEIDAATGKINETAFEDWEAGEEKDEKR